MTMRLDIFRADGPRPDGEETSQAAFFDDLEELLDALHKDGYEPDDVHSVLHNTRAWMALVKAPA